MNESSYLNRIIIGKVVSNKMQKTITVLIERKVKHPIYGKYVNRSTKVHAHDETEQCLVGDMVKIQQTRPLSKTKTWRFVELVEREPISLETGTEHDSNAN